MNPPIDERRRIAEILKAALMLDGSERSAFLDEHCPPGETREQIERLLQEAEADDSFLETGGGLGFVPPPTRAPAADPGESAAGQMIRGYRLIELIGTGGMGEVWKAEQTTPVRRLVALKLVKRGMDSDEVVARFESERQALAIMNHPNIARVFDGGVSETGRPFFVMELVRGIPITEYCDRNKLSTHERLDLFLQVCAGIQHAHHKGIIHRDIKPSNALVTTETGPPVPKMIDFGVARAINEPLTDKAMHTRLGVIIGTPGYMSPEQFEVGTTDVDTRADVYSLGVLLYEMLTSLTPFDWSEPERMGFDQLRHRLWEEEPPAPSSRIERATGSFEELARKHRARPAMLAAELRGDLDWIILKALRKDRTARYDSPHEMALDIERYLRDEPVVAGPPSALYRFSKFTRRNRTAFALGGAIAFGIVAAGVALTYALVESGRQRERAEVALAAEQEARLESDAVAAFLEDMMSSAGPRHAGRDVTVRTLIDEGAKTVDARFGDDSMVGARLRTTMGVVYDELGDYEKARPLLTDGLAIAEQVLGPENLELVRYLDRLADFHSNVGDYEEAGTLYQRSIAIQEKAYGASSPEVAGTLNNYSALLSKMGDHTGAAQALERSIEIQQKVYGEGHPHIVGLLNNVAVHLSAAGDYAGARKLCERALHAVESSMPPGHPWILTIRGNIADLLVAEGRIDTALVLQQEVLADRERILGEDHPDVALSLIGLSEVHRQMGDLDDALATADRALSIVERKLGAENPKAVPALRMRAEVYEDMGRLAVARADLERALRIADATDGASPESTEEIVKNLHRVLTAMGDTAAADRIAARVSTGTVSRD
ncbi:MAG: serine/threonine-protein kinase [Candidatus Eisenbacteria bacterium]